VTAASVRHLGCPACGATLTRRPDERTVRCRACGNRSVLVGIDAAPRSCVVPRVSRERATVIVRTHLAKWPVRDGTAERAAVLACELFWVPYAEFEALQAGTVRRSKGVQHVRAGRVDWSDGWRRFVDAHGNEITEREHYERRPQEVVDTAVLLRTHRAAGPAAGLPDWGLDAVDPAKLRDDPDVRLVPFGSPEAPPGHVLAPRRGRSEAEDELRRRAVAMGSETHFEFLASDLRYLYVPVWLVRYRVDRHPYAFVVDGVHGRVLAGRAPETPRRGVVAVVVAAALVGFPLGKAAAALAGGDAATVGHALAIALESVAQLGVFAMILPVLLLIPLAYAWGEFRFRGEVVFGPAGARVVKLARPAQTLPERLLDKLLDAMDRQVAESVDR
jgi:hypothetical protein